jgi:hypothetical protein
MPFRKSSFIDHCRPKDANEPANQVLHHALKHLMKDIWCYQNKDVSEWKSCLEWMDYGFQSSFVASQMKCMDVPIHQKICVDHCPLHAQWK